ncbi:hypothetical protein ACFYO5_11190 [Streptomyces sp. NPDC006259]|uniref:hypothetical protein n=1 Tax=Streptomyces sp. NPDC006259 TaxID=3364740 RepID=UPI003681A335
MSLRLLTGAAGTALVLALSATAVHATPAVAADNCAKALAVAEKTQKDYDSWLKWYNGLIAQGGHPGIAEQQALADAKADRDRTASQAQRICGP